MRITFVSGNDVGGFAGIMKKYMTRLGHEIYNIVGSETFIEYGNTDIVLSGARPENLAGEIHSIFRNTDFFVIRWATDSLLRGLGILEFLEPNNYIFKAHGSELRSSSYPWSLEMWKFLPRDHNGVVAAWLEPYLWKQWKSPVFYHIERPCDFERLPKRANPENPPFIYHSPTSIHKKGSLIFMSAIKTLKERKGKEVNVKYVTNTPYDQAQKIKSKSSLLFDQIGFMGGIGMASVEAMYMRIPCMAEIGPAIFSLHPELEDCIINVNHTTLGSALEAWVDNPDIYKDKGKLGKKYAKMEHDPLRIAKQYIHLFNEIKYGWTPTISLKPREDIVGMTLYDYSTRRYFESGGIEGANDVYYHDSTNLDPEIAKEYMGDKIRFETK